MPAKTMYTRTIFTLCQFISPIYRVLGVKNVEISAAKTLKWPPEKTEMANLPLIPSSVWPEIIYMVLYICFDENEMHFYLARQTFRVLGVKNGEISAAKSPKWPPEKTEMSNFLLIPSSVWPEIIYMVLQIWFDENEMHFSLAR